MTDIEIAGMARARGMAAIVLKNHFTMTADRAWLAERVTGQRCYGGIVLNRAVGGLNAEAIRRMVTFTGRRRRRGPARRSAGGTFRVPGVPNRSEIAGFV